MGWWQSHQIQVKFKKYTIKKIGMFKGMYVQQQKDVFNKVSDSFESTKQDGQWASLLIPSPTYWIHSPSPTTWFSRPAVIHDLAQWQFFPQGSQSKVLGTFSLALIPSDHNLISWFIQLLLWTVTSTRCICIWYKEWKYVIEISLIRKEKVWLRVCMGWTWANRCNTDVYGVVGG